MFTVQLPSRIISPLGTSFRTTSTRPVDALSRSSPTLLFIDSDFCSVTTFSDQHMGTIFGKESPQAKQKADGKSNHPPPAINKSKVTDKDRAILELKNARDKLQKFRKKLDGECTKIHEKARCFVREGQKERALVLLKLRKFKMKEADTVEAQLLTVLQMIDDVEWTSMNVEVMNAIQAGNVALKKMHEEMSLDDVEAILEESKEAAIKEDQIADLLSGQFTSEEAVALEEELEALMQESIQPQQSPAADIASKLPDAPSGEILINVGPKKDQKSEQRTAVLS